MEKFKDVIYEISDLIFGFVVLIFIIVISTYQLHGWFNISMPKNLDQIIATSNNEEFSSPENESPQSDLNSIPDDSLTSEENSEALTNTEEEISGQSLNEEANIDEPTNQETLISLRNITIASGSSSDMVANALYENSIINSKDEFISRLIDLKSETKIKAGIFQIPSDSTLDEVIKIITQ